MTGNSSSPLFSGCLLPINITEKTFLQLKRENDQVKKERFLLPVERSVLQEMKDQHGCSRQMRDVWCPWQNYAPDIEFIEEIASWDNIVNSLEKYEDITLEGRKMKVLPSST